MAKTTISQRAHKQHTVAEEVYLTPPSEVSADAFARRLIEMSLHFAVVLLMTLQKTLKRLPRSPPPRYVNQSLRVPAGESRACRGRSAGLGLLLKWD